MQLTKSRVEHWVEFWDELFPKIALACGSSALVFTTASMLTRGYEASRIFNWLFGVACTVAILFAAAYAVMAGLFIYFKRRRENRLSALAGISFGVLFGAFLGVLAFAGLFAVSAHHF